MSAFAKKVKDYYDRGLWDVSRVQVALKLCKITQDEYNSIVN